MDPSAKISGAGWKVPVGLPCRLSYLTLPWGVGKRKMSVKCRWVCETATASTAICSSSVLWLSLLGPECAIYCLSIYMCCERKNESIMWKANILYKIKNKPQPPAQLFFGIYSYIVGASTLVIDELFFPGPVASIMQHPPTWKWMTAAPGCQWLLLLRGWHGQ